MEDGSAPPVIVAIERVCSDHYGDAPGPVTNKKGEFIWQMEIDPLDARDCRLRATHTGYTSTLVEVSGLDTTRTSLDLPPIIINSSVADPSAIIVADSGNTRTRAKGLGRGDESPGCARYGGSGPPAGSHSGWVAEISRKPGMPWAWWMNG